MSCPYISVITVAAGGPERLERVALALSRQTLPPTSFEWVVHLREPGGRAPEWLGDGSLPFAVKVVELPQRLPLGLARNACADRTCGSILLFSDDDWLPAPDALAAHVAEQERGLCVSVGAIEVDDGNGRRRWRPRRAGYWNLNAASCSVPGVAFRQVGGFDGEPGDDGGEDLELGHRLARAGLPFRPLAGALTVHLGPDPRSGADLAKARAAGANAARLARRHAPVRWRLGLHPAQVAFKRGLFALGLGAWFERFGGGSVAYERAYLEGAFHAGETPVEESS